MTSRARRQERVAAAIQEEVARFLFGGVKDPRITAMVTVTGAEVSHDYRHAKVFVSIYGDAAEQERTFEGLRSLASHLRAVVGRNLGLRSAPEISFVHDETAARASRIEELLAEVRGSGTKDGGDASP